MTLYDLELYKFEFSENLSGFRRFRRQQANNSYIRMKIDQYCQRQRCKHVELEQFLVCFRVARVCQRQLSFLVDNYDLVGLKMKPAWLYIHV